ncbi:MAG: helix-hairpin-helix domain-containing protein [Nitrososphaerota archaeon]|jgi:predicted flap endonuclease-1-like 5' DNA nuclease|nr:helix-hairpin-helix domain-containing protein [Nitrososphaerota archaeon]
MDYIIWAIVAIVLLIITLVVAYSQMPRAKKNIKTKVTTQTTIVEDEVVVKEEFPEEPCCESTPASNTFEEPVEEVQLPQKQDSQTLTPPASNTFEEPVEEEFLVKELELSMPQEETPVVSANDNEEVPIQPKQDEIPLTNVKGIGEKRAAQLNAIGITTVKDLAQTSATNLAKELDISPKITAKLIEDAKQQLQQQ